MERKKFTTTLQTDLLDDLKLQAVKEKRHINDILEQLISVYLQYVNSRHA